MPNDTKPKATPAAPRYEVLIDTWGAEPLHHKGDLITAADTPYDVEWGATIGALRLLPADEATVIAQAGTESTTQPVDPMTGKVDQDVQAAARDAAGAPREGDRPGPNSAGARQP